MKAEEIKLIELFTSKGYFADAFNEDDYLQMISNIRNDFHLLFNTRIQRELDKLKDKDLDKTRVEKDLEIAVSELKEASNKADNIMKSILDGENGIECIYRFFELSQIVEFKLKRDIPLTEEDKLFLLRKIQSPE